MAVTVTVPENPDRNNVAKTSADAVTINSGFTTGPVTYQVRRRDRQGLVMERTVSLTNSTPGPEDFPQLISRSVRSVTVILPFRTHFQARCRQAGGAWTAWVDFKTRDKRYQSPDAITQLSDDSWRNPTNKVSKTITVTNNAKATITNTSRGAHIVNTDNGYNSTTSITYTSRGARIVNSD